MRPQERNVYEPEPLMWDIRQKPQSGIDVGLPSEHFILRDGFTLPELLFGSQNDPKGVSDEGAQWVPYLRPSKRGLDHTIYAFSGLNA